MSQENLEAARRAYDAFNRRDLDAVLALVDPEVDFTTRFVERAESYHGHDGVRVWWEDLLRVFPDFKIEVVELSDLGDVTIGAVRVRGRGMGSDAPFEEVIWQVGKWRHGKLVAWHSFGSESEAREAGGIHD
jgi:ketosteroid isomerase-like protein